MSNMNFLSILLLVFVFSTECSDQFLALCAQKVPGNVNLLNAGTLPDGKYIAIYRQKDTKDTDDLVYTVKIGTDTAVSRVKLYGFVKTYHYISDTEQRTNVALRLLVGGAIRYLCMSPPECPVKATFSDQVVPVYFGKKKRISKKRKVSLKHINIDSH